MTLVLGVLILLNVYVWPKWMGIDGWVAFAGVLLVLGGLLTWWKPNCGHMSLPSGKKKS